MRGAYWTACALLALAIVCDVVSKPLATAAAGAVARNGEVRSDGQMRIPEEARRLIAWSDRACWAGLALAAVGVLMWFVSMRGAQGGHPIVPIILISAYLMLFMVVT